MSIIRRKNLLIISLLLTTISISNGGDTIDPNISSIYPFENTFSSDDSESSSLSSLYLYNALQQFTYERGLLSKEYFKDEAGNACDFSILPSPIGDISINSLRSERLLELSNLNFVEEFISSLLAEIYLNNSNGNTYFQYNGKNYFFSAKDPNIFLDWRYSAQITQKILNRECKFLRKELEKSPREYMFI